MVTFEYKTNRLDHNNSSLILVFTHLVDEQALHLLRKFHINPTSINRKNREILPQNPHRKSRKTHMFCPRRIVDNISAFERSSVQRAKHKNRKRRAQGSRAYAIHVRFLAVNSTWLFILILPDYKIKILLKIH